MLLLVYWYSRHSNDGGATKAPSSQPMIYPRLSLVISYTFSKTVVEQDFRCDSESDSEKDDGRCEFGKMMEEQNQTGSFLPEKAVAACDAAVDVEDVLKKHGEEE